MSALAGSSGKEAGTPAQQLKAIATAVPRYSRFTATRGAEQLLVSEQIYDESGRTWPDASSWFWSASLGQSAGPWWAVTIVEAGH